MSATTAQIARVRKLSGATEADFTDADITASIEAYPVYDSTGRFPDHADWDATYCLYNAAADILDQRAVTEAVKYDTTADGATLSRSQVSTALTELAKRLRARGAIKVKRALAVEPDDEYIINLPEVDEDD